MDGVLGTKGRDGSQGPSAVDGHKHALRKNSGAGLRADWVTEKVPGEVSGSCNTGQALPLKAT